MNDYRRLAVDDVLPLQAIMNSEVVGSNQKGEHHGNYLGNLCIFVW